MQSTAIRNKFIEFFKKRGHKQVVAAPIVNKGDPTLLFTNAGMNPFKELFLDHARTAHQRVSSIQPCLRVTGKHNDLEEVGLDTYHHTLFEMLGNWSFGDYFKEEAIQWAWELLTQVYELPAARLYVTIFRGDDTLAADAETEVIWKKYMAADRILAFPKQDNFWEMGATGPCGPCTEIHIDIRPEAACRQQPGTALVNTGHPQVIELWNLVFIQYNRLASGQLASLSAKHVDTGMGLERLARVMQGKTSNYDTDLFQPLIQAIEKATGKVYGQKEDLDIAIRVIADHIRAVTFSIADGQVPSNTKAGYVIRRILRRAIRYGYTYLDVKTPLMYQLIAGLATQFRAIYPAIQAQQSYIEKIIELEESAFLKTLTAGLHQIEQLYTARKGKAQVIDGPTAFELYDTHGFPLDLTRLIAKEKGMQIDEKGFYQALQAQRARSKKAAILEQHDWHILTKELKTTFVGYDQLETTAKIRQYRTIKTATQQLYQLVLDQTPFYPEGGGQVGDTGYLLTPTEEIAVQATQKEHGLIVHHTQCLPKDVQGTLKAVVDLQKRRLTTNNHSATHLLHAALRQVLGPHVAQKGSLVNEQLLRFDFSHGAKVDKATIQQIERMVNQKIRANIPCQVQCNVPLPKAKAMGAAALFGEKYGDYVRVITFDPNFSVELCGGTHVAATGQIGFFKIITEAASAAGVRRIEAVTAAAAENFVNQQFTVLAHLKEALKQPKDLVKAFQQLLQEKEALRQAVAAYQKAQIQAVTKHLQQSGQTIQGVHVLIASIILPHVAVLKQIAFQFKHTYQSLFLVLAAAINEKPYVAVLLSEDLVNRWQKNAQDIVQELAQPIQGGGGGQPFFATAGGKACTGLQQVLDLARKIFQQQNQLAIV